MMDEGLIGSSPEEVAHFLFYCARLEKVAKGEFLGDP